MIGKRRYLILRLGFAYYYENENATKPKGSICLHNCRYSYSLFYSLFTSLSIFSLSLSLSPLSVSPCTEEDRIKNHKWVFKVVPDDPKLRTFYITTAARHEMEVSENVNVVTCFLQSNKLSFTARQLLLC